MDEDGPSQARRGVAGLTLPVTSETSKTVAISSGRESDICSVSERHVCYKGALSSRWCLREGTKRSASSPSSPSL
ncbi:hypothetical protein E2C01_051394 [Portunus trituberculatus]|uniref:Uncharacterized protein n=1 Tax=Portunus trituberculatus TaxID=210409 RepID=A0A5B7GJ33_PORTR|nr:hypothetical protein [Portunus trituberculatus]